MKQVASVMEGIAAGWRVVTFTDGTVERMTARELLSVHRVNPFNGIEALDYDRL